MLVSLGCVKEKLQKRVKTQKVWLLAGQSNMIGHGADSSKLPEALKKVQTNVKIFTEVTGKWVNLGVGHGAGENGFGPELVFGREMAAALPEVEVLLIKSRFGLGNLYENWASPNTGRGPAGQWYKAYMDLVKKAMASKPNIEIAGMIWMQGEGDSYDDINEAESYDKNLILFIKSLRSDLNTPDMEFVIGQINEAKQWVYGEIVRRKQVKVAETTPCVTWFATNDLPLSGDGMHFSTKGYIELGKRFAQKAILLESGKKH